jgi:peptide/nickel transport system substrate-binding protein
MGLRADNPYLAGDGSDQGRKVGWADVPCGRLSVSRNDFGVALLAAAALACVVLGPASARTHAASKYGGTLVVGIAQSDPPSLDPSLGIGSGIEVMPLICERLYAYDAKSQIVPQLATARPTISKDKLTYTIQIRPGIQFNDGTPLNAAAMVTSIQRMITLPGSAHTSDFASVDTVTATGQYTVVIHLKERFTPLTATLASPAGIVMSPAQLGKLGANFGTSPVGVGPFMFDHRVVGDNITLVKSPYYYNKYAVHLDKIVFKPTIDAAAAGAALQAGDIQVLSGVDLTTIQQDSSLWLIHTTSLGYRGIAINIGNKNGVGNLPYAANVGTPLSSSATLRQAFEKAIDRNTMVRVLSNSLNQPGCTPISPGDPMYDPSITCTPYDPKDAKKLVAASGFPNPTVHLLTPNDTIALRVAEFIQAQEAAVGINVVIDSADIATVAARRRSGNFDTVLVSPAGSANTDSQLSSFETTSSGNSLGYSNPRLDLILANGRKATSLKALETLYHTAERIIIADRPIIILYHGVKFVGVSTSVTGVQLYPDLVPHVAFAQYK